MISDLTDFQTQVLVALVDGYRAREGLKERMRQLNEWEIARRSGFTEISYAGYMEHPARDKILQALTALQRLGFVEVRGQGAQYDTFVPTPKGATLVTADRDHQADPALPGAAPEPSAASKAVADPVLERLDEIIRLLRSLESKLGGC